MQGVLSLLLEVFGHLQGQPPVDGTIHINTWKLIAKKCKQHMDLMKDMSNCNSICFESLPRDELQDSPDTQQKHYALIGYNLENIHCCPVKDRTVCSAFTLLYWYCHALFGSFACEYFSALLKIILSLFCSINLFSFFICLFLTFKTITYCPYFALVKQHLSLHSCCEGWRIPQLSFCDTSI